MIRKLRYAWKYRVWPWECPIAVIVISLIVLASNYFFGWPR